MNPCTKVGIDVTWRCNANCGHCYFKRNPKLHQNDDYSLPDICAKIDLAKQGGLDHVYLVGHGEPSLAPEISTILDYAHKNGMATSMITNAATGLERMKGYFCQGIDHLHISSHGLGDTLDEIMQISGAFEKQTEVKEWLALEGLPFRSNVTMQQANYRELPELAEYEIGHGVFHFVFLGFLPHYEWRDHLTEVAVHPAELRPYIEEAAYRLMESDTYFTIRYHPFCHLDPSLWRYVVNARYVFFDPWEWNYSLQIHDPETLWRDSVACGETTACHDPCDGCSAYRHCGGWDTRYAAAFSGANLRPIVESPDMYRAVWNKNGGLHDLNPANHLSGTIGQSSFVGKLA